MLIVRLQLILIYAKNCFQCEKLSRKRSSFLGSLKVAHGSSLDDVDGKISQAKSALSRITKSNKERCYRWQQIENICGFKIVNSLTNSQDVELFTRQSMDDIIASVNSDDVIARSNSHNHDRVGGDDDADADGDDGDDGGCEYLPANSKKECFLSY